MKTEKRDRRAARFRIAWGNHAIVYNPEKGRIQKQDGATVAIPKIPSARFPAFRDLSPKALRSAFRPNCLTLFTGHHCNLSCRYCYGEPERDGGIDSIDPAVISPAAEFVAANARRRGLPFVLGFHGSCEPLLRSDIIDPCLAICRNIARRFNVTLLPFCTTNGVISPAIARWAADRFHGITLSWDGPADLHDANRPTTEGRATEWVVQRTGRLFLDPRNGLNQLRVRVTATRETAARLPEIAAYFHGHGIRHVEVYPVYQTRRKTIPADLIPEPGPFVKGFALARHWAERRGMTLGYAGSRIDAFHDRFCPVFQDNLTLTTDGHPTACFQVNRKTPDTEPFLYGSLTADEGDHFIDWVRLSGILRRLQYQPDHCQSCFNRLHCAKGCPDACPLEKNSLQSPEIDCRMSGSLGVLGLMSYAGIRIGPDDLEYLDDVFSGFEI